ncbi:MULTISPECIES: hypothetical protein [Streptomyces]|uniref:EF-hand domain-containing protein n=1 Tax=Streptomyces dengpaensis TaxID=2049881 RepID=A0ABM6T2R9_9ACTN|nr:MULTISPECIES: hypothetical protein [Streptomyces]AVH61331.1 hypothetical protein C4B68_21305 [Streptomyces dengpaensis]PIB03938.1 hypothetical protein B1C81_35415 [Streptomyces sp. HG99]
MSSHTLPRRARLGVPGWSHPYGIDPSVFYADAGDGKDDAAGDQDDDGKDDADDDQDDEAGAGDDDGADDDSDADPDGADKLGDPGKRALASMKGKWRSERDKRREAERKLAEKTTAGNDDAVSKATEAATAAANTRILKAEIRAAAKGRLADPKDALTFLDLSAFEVDADGAVDEDEIADAIEDLVKNKPYLAAAKATRFQGTGDGGAARKASRPKQLGEKDLKNMSAEAIVKAQDAGQLDEYLGAG